MCPLESGNVVWVLWQHCLCCGEGPNGSDSQPEFSNAKGTLCIVHPGYR
uniref:Uncharacterized protein n=1 Tax=Anguilla anguilla TaxID=7936 RepID=A0A0E9T3M5_ANGAN